MPQLKSLDELRSLRTRLQQDIRTRTESSTTVTVGMGTCGIAAGAREVMQAFLDELATRKMDAHIVTTGCIGMCAKEPLVDIQQADGPRITYGNVDTTMVPRIIEEHLVQGHVVQPWVVGQVARG